MANYIRSGFYTFKPGTLDPLIDKARQELPPLMQRQPGFLRYAVVRTGADSIASLTAWETRAQSEAAAQQLTGWVRENFGADLVSAENKIGEVILSDWSSGDAPAGVGPRARLHLPPPGGGDHPGGARGVSAAPQAAAGIQLLHRLADRR